MSMSQSDIDAMFGGGGDVKTEPVDVEPAEAQHTPPAAAGPKSPVEPDVQRILGISLPLIVTIAERDMSVEAILDVAVGAIIEFDQSFDTELRLSVGQCPIGTGHAVKVGENFGLRITAIDPLRDRIDALGGTPDSV